MLQDSGLTERDAARSLALFALQNISASGAIRSDKCITARISLHRIVLEDTRPGRELGITK